jgi:hypothetical protein
MNRVLRFWFVGPAMILGSTQICGAKTGLEANLS